MTPEQKAAEVMARVARALIRAAGMTAENAQRERQGNAMAYVHDDFMGVIDNEGIDSVSIHRLMNS